MTEQTELQLRPDCPKCGSNANITLSGWTDSHDRRKYCCTVCRHRFVFPRKAKSEYAQQRTEKIRQRNGKEPLPVFDFEALKLRHEKILDSVVYDVCCFCCPNKFCSPEKCDELAKWCWLNE